MSSKTIISCDWPSAKVLVGDINAAKLNVTNVVAQCVNVCELMFESKRNEILGEGIMISLLIQVTLFSIFGVSLPGIIWILNKRSTANVASSTILLRKIQTLLLETSGFLIISFFIAAISTFSQASTPSIIEVAFISRLLDLQFWQIFSMVTSQTIDKSMNQNQAARHWQLYYHALFIAQLATSSYIKIPNQSVYKTLAKECHKQHQFIDFISSVSDSNETLKFMGIGIGVFILFVMFLTLGITYITYVPPLLKKPWKILWSRIPSWLKSYAKTTFNFLQLVFVTAGIPMHFYRLEKVRELVMQTSGAQLAREGKWGYGQTTAILLWLPFFFSAIKETIKYIRNTYQTETPQVKMGSLGQEKPPPAPAVDMAPPPYDYPHPASISTAPKDKNEE